MYQLLLLAILSCFTFSVWAQSDDVVEASESAQVTVQQKEVTEQDEKKQKPADSKNVEKIEVTGSYVRRIDVEGPSPVVTVDKEDFNDAGVDTVNDYLKESPLFGGSSDSGDRDGYFRFRGQHAGSTLVLINGMRIPKLGGTSSNGFYNGVESIPTNVIERVEIVKDGSSALYGSDAMAGVMNFITKKNYEGAEYSNRINIPEINQGLQQNHNIAFGKTYSKSSWIATAQYVEQRGYTDKDVGNYYTTSNVTDPSSNVSLTTYKDAAGNQFKSNEKFQAQCANPDQTCEIDLRGVSYIREPRQNIGTMVSGHVELTSDITWNIAGMYNRRSRQDIGQPNYVNLDKSTGNQLTPAQLGSPELQAKATDAESVALSFRPLDEVGTRRIDVLQNAYTLQSQLQGYVGETWQWQAGGSYGYTLEERQHRNGLLDLNVVTQNIQNGYNPTNVGPQNAGALDNAQIFATEAYQSSLATTRILATGELFDFNNLYGAGGPFSLAIGAEGQWESTADVHDSILLNGSYNQQFLNQRGSRNITSAFMEMVMYPLQQVEFQVAGRLDNYSDWGNTFNPKVSLGYRPSKNILFRSSWGTNFNAPSLRNMIAAEVTEYNSLRLNPDFKQVNGVPVVRYTDPNLRPETGMNYNFGTVLQPNKSWTFTIDQWNFEGTSTITRFFNYDYNDAYASFVPGGNPDKDMESLGVYINRDSDGNITSVRAPHVFNMGDRTIRGLDIGTKFHNPIQLFGRVLRFGLNFDHTHMLVYRTKSAPTLPVSNRTDLEWKNNLNFSLGTQRHNYRVAARTLAGNTSTSASTRTHTEYDFNYGYRIPWWDGGIQLGVKNVFDTRPPVALNGTYVDYASGFDAYAFNALGRRYYVGYRQAF